METVVNRLEPRLEDVGINLSGRQIGVTEHHLDGTQVGPAVQQMRRKRVSQDVRAQRSRQLRANAVALQDLPKADPTEGSPSHVDEQARRRPAFEQFWPPFALVGADPRGRLLADRDEALFVSLSDAGQVVLVEGARLNPERAEFTRLLQVER